MRNTTTELVDSADNAGHGVSGGGVDHDRSIQASPQPNGASPVVPRPAVVVRQLSKTYLPSPGWMKLLLKSAINEPVVALEDVTFEVGQGEICVVIGPNGAGKSTLFRILTGLTTPTSGEATIMGHDIGEGRTVRSLIGFMPAEDRNLMLRHTCAQNLIFRGKLQGMSTRELTDRVDAVLDQVGILHARDRAATSLSTGMKARLQLAAALLHDPKVLILDEPTSAVDPVGAHELLILIEALTAERGLSVLLSSHRLEEIDALQNKVVLLDRGQVLHSGNLRTLRQTYEEPRYRIEFKPTVDMVELVTRLASIPDIEVTTAVGVLEIASSCSVGSIMTMLGEETDAILSFERVEAPLRVLMHKLISREITGQR